MQVSKARILLWAPFGAGMHYWGPGTNAFRLYRTAVQSSNISVDLAHGSNLQDSFPEVYNNQYLIQNIADHNKLSLLKFHIKTNSFLRNHASEYDVFHGIGGFHTTFHAAIKASEAGMPSFIKMTGLNGGFGNSSIISRLLGIERSRRKNGNNITGYIAISDAIRENLLKHGISPEKIHLIPNGVDTQVFSPVSNMKKQEIRQMLNIPDRITFIYVGGLTVNKRQHICVDAILKLIKDGFDLQLLLIGPDRNNGVELLNIQAVLNKYPELKDRIIFINHTDKPFLYYQASDYFFLISGYEGMPNSLLEAMSVGLPSIVTKIPGIIDLIVDDETGKFVEPNSEDIQDKVRRLLSSHTKSRLFSENAIKKIENNFSSTIVWTHHLKLFSNYIK